MEALSIELSTVVAGDPKKWDLAPLRANAERLVTSTTSTLDRAKAKRLVERIRDFESIHQRNVRLESMAKMKPAESQEKLAGGGNFFPRSIGVEFPRRRKSFDGDEWHGGRSRGGR